MYCSGICLLVCILNFFEIDIIYLINNFINIFFVLLRVVEVFYIVFDIFNVFRKFKMKC